ncbi:60S ribosome subunit biogenesis protein NIP7 [Perkinsela sp. CCAP 1560/4]|nr:60S ribosome subunit biogenesis protein NIP7 [Perkinsela sp. CCAP 1560/4]|eukprot:KNH08945.1 60S ribosome subunit biogenesis protein NIP7 [Perkinsela sp. CCAP 1560/4]
MRSLKRHESEKLFAKLSKYLGAQTAAVHEVDGEKWVFRVHKKKIFYLRADLEKTIAQINKKNLISVGCCVARITHNNNIRIVVTALHLLAANAPTKFWVKPNQEQAFLYGNNVTRNGLGRISDAALQHQGCVVYSMGDIPLGFGVTAQSTAQSRRSESNAIALFHEADIGEYIRNEDGL